MRLLHPGLVQVGVKPDDKLVPDPIGRGAQVPARAHGIFENRLLLGLVRRKVQHFFALGDGNRTGVFEERPGVLLINLDLLGIDNLFDRDLLGLKKLLSILTGRSALAQVCPINFHIILLWL